MVDRFIFFNKGKRISDHHFINWFYGYYWNRLYLDHSRSSHSAAHPEWYPWNRSRCVKVLVSRNLLFSEYFFRIIFSCKVVVSKNYTQKGIPTGLITAGKAIIHLTKDYACTCKLYYISIKFKTFLTYFFY